MSLGETSKAQTTMGRRHHSKHEIIWSVILNHWTELTCVAEAGASFCILLCPRVGYIRPFWRTSSTTTCEFPHCGRVGFTTQSMLPPHFVAQNHLVKSVWLISVVPPWLEFARFVRTYTGDIMLVDQHCDVMKVNSKQTCCVGVVIIVVYFEVVFFAHG